MTWCQWCLLKKTQKFTWLEMGINIFKACCCLLILLCQYFGAIVFLWRILGDTDIHYPVGRKIHCLLWFSVQPFWPQRRYIISDSAAEWDAFFDVSCGFPNRTGTTMWPIHVLWGLTVIRLWLGCPSKGMIILLVTGILLKRVPLEKEMGGTVVYRIIR